MIEPYAMPNVLRNAIQMSMACSNSEAVAMPAFASTIRNMHSTFPERLKIARIAAGFRTAREFTDTHGVPYATYHMHESGQRSPDLDTQRKYAAIFGVDEAWMVLGRGDGPKGAPPDLGEEAPASAPRQTSEQRRLLDLCDRLRRSIIKNDVQRAIRLAESVAADLRVAELDSQGSDNH
ncbi:helix-turn-helix transcriptional regulator [Nitrospirillum iridis]|uniref:Transcriptional regulator with XRE-family HTH domain n=1 Tax=Nitrospirillum iridis TaxID=765888 RepID=A0A7X0AWJ6_9PROT|nr:helix-turn-helix transcriptional regulator [Nitrospirillum iridis]MBB6251408.1 transcriptional regulator with XRE-family HTH domain [Nitrospirillum iridis]